MVEAFPDDTVPGYLVRDRDGIYGHDFTTRVDGLGIRQVPISARRPWQNCYAERITQTALRQRQYYGGVTNGRLDDATRRSIAHYQIDNNEPATGDLDQATVASLGIGRTGVDSASNGEALARQRAAEINRKAARLLDTYQKRLGVRVNDIRHKVLSEGDLDLLLQVDAFAKAAAWYEQSSRPGTSLGARFDNFGRILLRSATRVEQTMERASQDRRFGDTWSSIQANLADIEPDKGFSVR